MLEQPLVLEQAAGAGAGAGAGLCVVSGAGLFVVSGAGGDGSGWWFRGAYRPCK